MFDGLGRQITYLRVSVTDRCDLRCFYCMGADPSFLPHSDVLTLEEISRVCRAFVDLGVTKIRITGGEPLVRRDVMLLFQELGALLQDTALKEITLTTNGTRLERYAAGLARCGVRRVNVSLDTLDPQQFSEITGRKAHSMVLAGVEAARHAGLRVKINSVVLPDADPRRFEALMEWCGALGFDLTLIEAMPLGGLAEDKRSMQSLRQVREFLSRRWNLLPLTERTAGPARYVKVAQTGVRLGFITPLSHDFCDGCNRVRLTCQGDLKLCLGHDVCVGLKAVLRSGGDDEVLKSAILAAIKTKPPAHKFIGGDGAVIGRSGREMNSFGG